MHNNDHLEGHNKIQDKHKSKEFVVVGKHPEPNIYHIKQVSGNGPVWTANQCQLQDLGKTQDIGEPTTPQSPQDGLQVPSFNPKVILTKSTQILIIMPLTQKGDLQHFPTVPLPAWEAVECNQH